eukprot:snap_masked-scaffold_90-processed-gene-0.6-mRNA-1 protein AED:1.00 eAED:1.00 QI:0/0/0/0/1/1/2/0/59
MGAIFKDAGIIEGSPATIGSVHFTLSPAPSLFCLGIGNYCSAHRLFRRSIMKKKFGKSI